MLFLRSRTNRRATRLALVVGISVLAGSATPAHPWSALGHQLVGELAQRRLTPEASARVAELLHAEPVPSLAGVAMWADTLRASDPERFKATARWHYVNMPVGTCAFVAARDCADGACVVGAIETQRRLLSDPAQPLAVRREALKFVVHFVGDVHQPMHSSNRPDRGGNDFQISLRTGMAPEEYARANYQNGIMGTNLHAVWDYYVLGSAALPLRAYADRLAAAPDASPGTQSDPAAWATESCGFVARLYPRTHKMTESYLVEMRPLAEQRVVVAANRLARLLNEVFAAPASRR